MTAPSIKSITVATHSATEMLDITGDIARVVSANGVRHGVCLVFVPHTTAGITLNENADPSVRDDMLMELNKRIPLADGYRHSEGNSAAHIKASLMGSAVTVLLQDSRPALGTWQGIYLCEFDGPRQRTVWVKVIDA
jgi:secondary thiamine-phosphate synthase enzyme